VRIGHAIEHAAQALGIEARDDEGWVTHKKLLGKAPKRTSEILKAKAKKAKGGSCCPASLPQPRAF